MYQTVRGLIIRSVDYKEADKILTVLTDTRGCLTVKARGVRRKGSRLKAAAQLFAYSQMTLYEQNGRATLHEAQVLEAFSGLQTDIVKMALASYFAEVLGTEAEDAPTDTDIQRLALNCLYALANDLCEPSVVKAAFELRYMRLAGYAPDLTGCAVCGREDPLLPVAMLEIGTVRCGGCTVAGYAGRQMPIGAAVLQAARYILSCDLKKLFSFRLPPEDMARLARVCEAWLLACMERGFRTLDFYKSVGETP
ncbi:MAG: DNA repair protein RecO [Clostridia bacterium]|nr:DNA repair protein RecO [Clostridia bacterium]